MVFNALAEHPETAAAYLAPRVRSAVARRAASVRLRDLSPPRILAKLLAAPFRGARHLNPGSGAAKWRPEPERVASAAGRRAVRRAAVRTRGLALSYATSVAAVFLALATGFGGGGGGGG